VILSKTGSLYQQPNLFRFFLSTSSVLEHELKTHISDVLIDAYNKKEVQIAKTEHRNAELLPKVSAHIMRHTACTRMAERE
jgi:integrase